MKSKSKFFLFVVIFICLLGGAYLLYSALGKSAPNQLSATSESSDTSSQSSSSSSEDSQKTPAPDFTVFDGNGTEIHLSDFVGKPIVLNFWASWCGPCQSEMPHFQQKYLELNGDVHFLMINMTDGSRETVETASSFLLASGYTFPVFFDTKSDAASTYGAYSLPTTYFIDSEG